VEGVYQTGRGVVRALTIRGVTKQVTLPVVCPGGLLWNAALETGGFLVGDDVKISISIQAAAQQPVAA
jgi:hypothetical protein